MIHTVALPGGAFAEIEMPQPLTPAMFAHLRLWLDFMEEALITPMEGGDRDGIR